MIAAAGYVDSLVALQATPYGAALEEKRQREASLHEAFTPEELERAKDAARRLLGIPEDHTDHLQDLLDRGVSIVGGKYNVSRPLMVGKNRIIIRDVHLTYIGPAGQGTPVIQVNAKQCSITNCYFDAGIGAPVVSAAGQKQPRKKR